MRTSRFILVAADGIILFFLWLCSPQFLKIYLFICWLCWAFIASRAFSLVATRGGYSAVVVRGLLTVVASLVAVVGSVVVVHGLSYSETCGIFWDRVSNPCLLHWQVDSLPLSHQGSPPLGI